VASNDDSTATGDPGGPVTPVEAKGSLTGADPSATRGVSVAPSGTASDDPATMKTAKRPERTVGKKG